MADIVYRQMPAPRELPQQIPAHGQILGCKSPRVRANFWCKSLGVRGGGGGMVMDEIDTCIKDYRRIGGPEAELAVTMSTGMLHAFFSVGG